MSVWSSDVQALLDTRIGRLGPLAGALELASRARASSLGRAELLLEHARRRWGARRRSWPIGFVWVREIVCVGLLNFNSTQIGRSTPRNGRPDLVGFSGTGEIAAQGCSVGLAETRDRAA